MTKELRLGIIGVSGRGKTAYLAHNPNRNTYIVAGADISKDALQQFHSHFPEARLYTDYKELFDQEKLDGVFIMSPDYCHEEQAIDALQRGIGVYLEKPMAITLRGCDRILKTAYKKKSKLFLGHNMRYMQFVQKMKEIIQQGTIGEVKAIWCRHFISYGGDAYFCDWHSERKYTTSLLLQKGTHDIDVIHWLAGSFTQRVTGFGSLSVYNRCKRREVGQPYSVRFNEHRWPPLQQDGFSPIIDVEDHNMLLMELANGVQAAYLQCHYTPDAWRNYTVIGTQGRIENYGDFGDTCTIEVWTQRKDTFRLKGDQSYSFEKKVGGHGGADQKIIEAFLDYLQNDSPPLTSPVAARYSVATGFLGAKSIRSKGRPFTIPPLDPTLEKAFNSPF